MRFFLKVSYNGTRYNGWQRQPGSPSVQQALEEALSTRLREDIAVVGAGRTDTGVHATCCVAHFDTISPEPCEGRSFSDKLNSMLPADIAVHKTVPVSPEAHARFDATEREYKYYIITHKDPFRTETAWFCRWPLDLDAMNSAAATLLRAEEFTTFSKLHSANKTDRCDVRHALWERLATGEIVFTIRADRFLRNMVRSIVGTLVDVGRGKLSADDFGAILDARNRSLASSSAPPHGLFLTCVRYPESIFAGDAT